MKYHVFKRTIFSLVTEIAHENCTNVQAIELAERIAKDNKTRLVEVYSDKGKCIYSKFFNNR